MSGKSEGKTLVEVLGNGKGDHIALVSPEGPALTYDNLRTQVTRLMGQLKDFGIHKEDRVAIVLPNGLEVVASFLAVTGVATAAPLNAAYKPDEFEFYLDDTNARAVITGPDAGQEAVDAAPKGAIHIIVTMDSSGEINFTGPSDATPSKDPRR